MQFLCEINTSLLDINTILLEINTNLVGTCTNSKSIQIYWKSMQIYLESIQFLLKSLEFGSWKEIHWCLKGLIWISKGNPLIVGGNLIHWERKSIGLKGNPLIFKGLRKEFQYPSRSSLRNLKINEISPHGDLAAPKGVSFEIIEIYWIWKQSIQFGSNSLEN